MMRWVLTLLFVLSIILANWLTSTYGLVHIGLGLAVTAGTFAAGLTFLFRDWVQEAESRRYVVGLIAVGALLSAWVADGRIALASGIAFLVSELADFAVYTPLRRKGYVRASLASNAVGALVDTVLFLALAGFILSASSIAGQMVVKVGMTAVVIAVCGAWPLSRIQPSARSRVAA